MTPFWTLARRMLRYRRMLAAALVCALLSAGGLGAGLAVLEFVADAYVMGEEDARPGLADLGGRLDERLGGVIPDGWIGGLPNGPATALASIVVGLIVLTVLGGLANFGHVFLSLGVVHRTVTGIRRELFHRVVRLPLRVVVAEGSADAVSRIVNDTTALGQGFNALVSKAVREAGRGAVGLVMAFYFDWRIALVTLPVAFVLYHVIRKLGKRIRRSSRSALANQADLYRVAAEALQGLRVVKVHTTERFEAGRFHRSNKEVLRHLLRVRAARALASPLVEVLGFSALLILLLVAMKAMLDGEMDPTNFVFALGSLGLAAGALKPLTGLVSDVQQSSGAAERVLRLLEATPEPGHDSRLPRLGRHRESITLEGVRFRYPGSERAALDGVSLRVERGERVAIVGPNGSGKTTLLAMIPRLFDPDGGVVRIDGRDVREVSIRSLRRQIGMVTQETVLFRASIEENIAYGAEGATRERVIAAARAARAHEFIERLPKGYGAMVGEQGLTLSGGQRQRIAIARAILRDPAILLLDEATSMIDADSEARIGEAIAEFTRGRTCLIVAHRLSTVRTADRIVVMDEGRIVDEGRHEEIIDRCETYRLLTRTQLVPGGV